MFLNKIQQLKPYQKILVFLIPSIILLIFFSTISYFSINSAKIEILVEPKNAELYIDGKKYPNRGNFHTTPGKKEVTIKAPGFKEYKKDLFFTANISTFIYEMLEPDESNQDYFSKNPDAGNLQEEIYEEKLTKEIDQYNKDPIFDNTPVQNFKLGFSASATRDEKDFNKITLTIDLMTCRDNQVENLKKVAESYFRQKGINLSKYQVKYTHCNSDQESDPNFKHGSDD
ncbi:hypothetical protein HG462_002460 [Candidatus Saccharibacteria bacterium]|nr:hypothetical protein [Candidatus Saccharibacteria bacterium]